MIRYLFNHSKWFRNQINRINFNQQSKPKGFSDLTEAFIDSKGKRYYTWVNEFNMPILRFNKLQEHILELQNCFTGNELTKFFDAMETALDDSMNAKTEKGTVKNIGKIGFLIKEARMRKEMLVHPEILFAMTAAIYIREDQDPTVWDQSEEEEKIEQFKVDSQGGLADFFYSRGLKDYIPYLRDFKGDWETLFQQWEQKNQRWMQVMTTITTEQKQYADKEKTQKT